MAKSKARSSRYNRARSYIGAISKKISAIQKFVPSSALGKRVIFLTVACSALLAIIVTGFELLSSYRGGASRVEQIHRNVEVIFSDSLREDLWTMNDASRLGILEGMVRLEAIDRAVLNWDGRESLSAGVEPDYSDVHTHIELVRSPDGAPQMLGTLHLYSSLTPLRQSLYAQFGWLLLANMTKSILVAGFALFLFHRLYTVHVLHIAKYARNFEVERKIKPLRLQRSAVTNYQFDELQELVDSLNNVGLRVRSAHNQIADQNTQLEQLLAERSQSLDVAQEKLLERSRLATIGAVVAMVAHELRNPLGAIKASLMMATKHQTIPVEDTDRALNRIESCVVRCDQTIESLRLLSRRKQLQFQELDFGRWVEGQLERQDIDTGAVSVNLDLQKEVYVAMDALTISQVFNNLIENSIQAMERNGTTQGGDIFIRLYNRGQSACLEIIDSGEGFQDKDIERVFDPLYTTKPSGFGMGLSLSRSLVEEHAGTLTLMPRKFGSGAIATLQLPLVETKSKENEAADQLTGA